MAALGYATLANVKTRLKITDDTDNTVLTTIVGQVNGWLEGEIRCPVGPSSALTLTLDGSAAIEGGRMLFVRQGIRTLTQLEIAPYTSATFEVVPIGDALVRPLEHDRKPDWPAQQLWLADVRTGNYGTFPRGTGNVRLTGTFGFAAIPVDLVEIAEVICVRAFRARTSGQRDMAGNDEQGQPMVSRYVAWRDEKTIRRYRNGLRAYRGT